MNVKVHGRILHIAFSLSIVLWLIQAVWMMSCGHFLYHNYSCDEWAGWNGYNEKAFTEKDFPLTHFAVLPEGIVLTYHPYQIDCFAAGEYHAVIHFKEANKCLMFDYSKHEDLKPKLQRFIK